LFSESVSAEVLLAEILAIAHTYRSKRQDPTGLDFIPGVSNIKGLTEAIPGIDYVTGQPLSTFDRVLSGTTAIPLAGNIVSYGSKAVKWASHKRHS